MQHPVEQMYVPVHPVGCMTVRVPVSRPLQGPEPHSSASLGHLGKAGSASPWEASVWIYEAACVKWEASLENVGAKMLCNTTQGKESAYT